MKIISRRKYLGAAVKWTKAELFWRDESPSTNMTWTSMGTTNCCLGRKTESTLRNFGNLLTSSAWRRKECGDASGT